ncbi:MULTISPECIES: type II toxin-antitoxin system HicA family toxin [Nostocales]|nr:type II toxin-antitoxin system HicA family toxin [Tolypothrix bouteillei]
MSGKELTKLLERNGWILLRVQGSHHIYGKPGIASRISVPIHGNKGLKVGLLRHLLKTAGLLEGLSQEKPVDETLDEQEDRKESE